MKCFILFFLCFSLCVAQNFHVKAIWTYDASTGSNTAVLKIVDTTSNTGTGPLFQVSSAASSLAKPVQFDSNGNGVQMSTAGLFASIGTGGISATHLNGTSLAGLATGILKNTTTTGAPSIAAASDFPAQRFTSSTQATVALSLTRWFGAGAVQATENLAWAQTNTAKTASNMRCWASATTGGSDSTHNATITFRVNSAAAGTPSTMSIVLNSASTAGPVAGSFVGNDSTNSVAMSAGALYDFQIVTGSAVTSVAYGCSVSIQ